jgi:hypothetical protein
MEDALPYFVENNSFEDAPLVASRTLAKFETPASSSDNGLEKLLGSDGPVLVEAAADIPEAEAELV